MTTLPLIVGVGASAGGLEALRELVANLNETDEITIIFVQHLDPNTKSLLSDLISKCTSMDVIDLKIGRRKIKANSVYICPPRGLLALEDGAVQCTMLDADDRETNVIDHFFHSIADTQGERGVGVILSGLGTDGTLGLKAISDCGGLTFAQDAKSANYDSMPRSAATTGVADHVMPPGKIAEELVQYIVHLDGLRELKTVAETQAEVEAAIPAIAESLMRVTNHNFQHYKTNTLVRRIRRRLQILKIRSPSDYIHYLQQNDDEAVALFRELLIGVTAFFRDPEAFDSMSANVLPKLFAGRMPDDCVRMWVAGCASGEEAYTMAILCREVMDEIDSPCTVQIFATDIDERALLIAREGSYPVGIEDQVSPERLKRFFIKRGKRYQVAKEIRELVLFSAHNLISDPPFSRQDLITCRNLLIYLGGHLQKKLIPQFHYSLKPSGYLFLGPSENIASHGELFHTIDAKNRISQRKGTALGTSPAVKMRHNPMGPASNSVSPPDAATDLTAIGQRIILDEFAPRYAIVDESGQILNSSANVEKYLRLGGGDYQNNIFRMAASGLRIGLRAAMAEAKKVRRRIQHDNLSIREGNHIQRVMLTVQPMPRLGEDDPLLMVVFHDVGLPMDVNTENREANRSSDRPANSALSTADDVDALIVQMEREIETVRSDLDKSLQDMEAANEELKSSNEELLSMNEELQSANEELETSKEEIRASSDAVARANDDLENLLRSTQIATVFLDDKLNIRSFTPAISEIYPLIPTDLGRPLQRFAPMVVAMPPLPDPKTIALASRWRTQSSPILGNPTSAGSCHTNPTRAIAKALSSHSLM